MIENDDLLRAFVNKNEKFVFYKNAFDKFNVDGKPKFRVVWSWWSFFFGFFFLLYRKSYLGAVLFVVISSIVSSIISLLVAIPLVWIVRGSLGMYFVHKKYLSVLETVKKLPEEKQIQTMKKLGGFHQWVVYVATIVEIMFVLWVGFALFVLNMFHGYYG